MRPNGDAYIVVGAPGTSIALVSEKLSRCLGGTWGGAGIFGRRRVVLSRALSLVFTRRKPVVYYLTNPRPADLDRIDDAMAATRRTLVRVIWLQIPEPAQAANREQWDRYRSEAIPAIWTWVERGLVSRVTAAAEYEEVTELAWQALGEPPMANPGPLYIFIGPPGAPITEQAERLANRLNAIRARPYDAHAFRWAALGAALGTQFSPSETIVVEIAGISRENLRLFDSALELAGRRITRVFWLLKFQKTGDPAVQWDYYRREVYPAILTWRDRRLVSDITADLYPDAIASLIWSALDQEPSFP